MQSIFSKLTELGCSSAENLCWSHTMDNKKCTIPQCEICIWSSFFDILTDKICQEIHEDTAFVYHGKQCFHPMVNSTTVDIRIICELNCNIF